MSVNDIEIFGQPRTVRLVGNWRGMTHAAPLECWIMAMIEILTPEQKDKFFSLLDKVKEARDAHVQKARSAGTEQGDIGRVVAEILMPNMRE